MLICESCTEAKTTTRERWEEVGDRFYATDICDDCNFSRSAPLPCEKPSRGGTHTAEERAIIRERGDLPKYWWRQRWHEMTFRDDERLSMTRAELDRMLDEAFRRGAEAMRDAAANEIEWNVDEKHAIARHILFYAEHIRTLDVPEDKR